MKITIYSPLPAFLLERFVSFEQEFNGKSWAEVYEAIATLKSQYPNKKFNDQPYLYLDLENKRNGYLFMERESDELYYVHN